MQLGRIAASEPLDRDFGYGRGRPIDRYYIERFLAAHAADIRGRVLEVGDSSYTTRFGAARVTARDVLHIQPEQPQATITGDLSQPGMLPRDRFDCIILTQTLQFVFDMPAALRNLHDALVPGGVLLLTVPGISPVDRGEWGHCWHCGLTEHSAAGLLCGPFERGRVTVRTHGNLFAATAFLHGAAVEDVDVRKLDRVDPQFPVTVAARAQR